MTPDNLLRWGLRVVEQPVDEPLTLDEAKLHMRLDDDPGSPSFHPDDELIAVLITAAREWCEGYTSLAFAPQVIELGADGFTPTPWRQCCVRLSVDGVSQVYGAYIELRYGPVSGIQYVTYLDGDGVTQTVDAASYVLDDYAQPARLYAAAGVSWPTAQFTSNSVRIRYYTGFDLPGSSPENYPLPASFLAAMKLLVGHLYENREDTTELNLQHIPLGVRSLLDRFALRNGFA